MQTHSYEENLRFFKNILTYDSFYKLLKNKASYKKIKILRQSNLIEIEFENGPVFKLNFEVKNCEDYNIVVFTSLLSYIIFVDSSNFKDSLKFIPKFSIIFLEDTDLLGSIFLSFNIKNLFENKKNIFFINCIDDINILIDLLSENIYLLEKPVLNIQIPSYNNLVNQKNQNTLFLYQYFSKKFNDLISDYSTHIIMLPKQIINTIENLKYINKTLYILKDNEIYTLVISAGPSLNDKIDLIKKIQKNVYIIAVDTALRFLLKNDIIPDLVIAIDPQTINFLDFVGIQNLTKTILAIEISSSYKIAEKYSNYKYLTFFIGKLPSSENKDSFSYVNPLSSFIAKNLSLFSFPVYGNVGIAAISLASLISNNLILAGFDGSFENLIYHCKETMDINYYLSYQNYLNKALSSLTKDSLKILINNGKRSSIQLEKNNDIFKKYFPDKNIIQINNLNNEYLLIEKIKKSRKVDLIGVKKIDNIIINYENKTNTNVDLKNQILQAIDKSFVYFEAGKIKNKSKIDNLIKRLFNLIN